MTALFVPLEQLLYVYRSLHVNCELQISHANLELRFPRKKNTTADGSPRTRPGYVCFHFTNKIYNALTLLTPTPTLVL